MITFPNSNPSLLNKIIGTVRININEQEIPLCGAAQQLRLVTLIERDRTGAGREANHRPRAEITGAVCTGCRILRIAAKLQVPVLPAQDEQPDGLPKSHANYVRSPHHPIIPRH